METSDTFRPAIEMVFLLGALGFLECREPLLGQIGRQGRVVLGVEQHAHRGPFAHEHIGSDDGHVGDYTLAQHLGQGAFAQSELPLEAIVQTEVEPTFGDDIAHFAAPLIHAMPQPEEVGEVAEAYVQTLDRHASGDRFDGRIGRGRIEQLRLGLGQFLR